MINDVSRLAHQQRSGIAVAECRAYHRSIRQFRYHIVSYINAQYALIVNSKKKNLTRDRIGLGFGTVLPAPCHPNGKYTYDWPLTTPPPSYARSAWCVVHLPLLSLLVTERHKQWVQCWESKSMNNKLIIISKRKKNVKLLMCMQCTTSNDDDNAAPLPPRCACNYLLKMLFPMHSFWRILYVTHTHTQTAYNSHASKAKKKKKQRRRAPRDGETLTTQFTISVHQQTLCAPAEAAKQKKKSAQSYSLRGDTHQSIRTAKSINSI